MKHRRIGFSGAHGQGKSTLINDIVNHSQFASHIKDINAQCVLHSSPSRDIAKHAGVHLVNEAGSGVTQIQIMHTHYINAMASDDSSVHLYDRSAVDGFVYSMCLSDRISVEQLDIITKYFHATIPKYDVIFYVEPEIELVQDGVRSVNIEFFNNVKNMFETVLRAQHLPTLVRLRGSREERLDTVCKYLFHS